MPESSAKPLPPGNRQEAVAGVLFWIGLFMMGGIPLWLYIGSYKEMQRQHHIVATYQEIQAKVVSSGTKEWTGSHDVKHYDAVILYRYEVNGRTYQSDVLAPILLWGSEEWADSIVAGYRAGQTCTAYYDPENPGQAILLRHHYLSPYRELLMMAFVLTGGSFFVSYLWYAKKRKLTPADDGWFAIAPESGERQKLFSAKVCTAVWYVFGSIPAAHYFLYVPAPRSSTAIHAFAIFYGLGLIPVLFLIRYWRMSRDMDEARVLVDRAESSLGGRLKFSITQTVRRDLKLKHATFCLRCLGITRHGKYSSSTTLFETAPVEVKDRALHAGEDWELSGDWTLPSNQRPAGRDATGKYSWIAWKLYLDCKFLHAPGYSTEYRLEVKAPPPEMPEAPVSAVKSGVYAEVRAIDPQFAGRIMSKGNFAIGQLLGTVPVFVQVPGFILVMAAILTLNPKQNDPTIFNISKQQAQLALGIGIPLVVVASIWGIFFPGRLSNGYIMAVARREIKRRPDAIVEPGDDSQYLSIIPRENWNRGMFRTSKDTGLLTVDASRREIRFEGDKERYRIPVDALLSCDVQKSVFLAIAKPTAPGYFMVVLQAQTASGVWEAPVAPTTSGSIFKSKARQQAAEALHKKIMALHPAMVKRVAPASHSGTRLVTPVHPLQ
jgi:Protein of unknown function (DUF3592)